MCTVAQIAIKKSSTCWVFGYKLKSFVTKSTHPLFFYDLRIQNCKEYCVYTLDNKRGNTRLIVPPTRWRLQWHLKMSISVIQKIAVLKKLLLVGRSLLGLKMKGKV